MTAEETLKKWIKESDNIVFFGGAGVSTESGIPDFRSQDGLYSQQYDYPPETIISHSFYKSNPKEFYRFYKNKMIYVDAKPNEAHLALAKLEQNGNLKAVITQNIDRNYCTRCKKFYGLDTVREAKEEPRCDCGGMIKPDVVLYEEGLDQSVLQKAVYYISHADVLIVGGTSLTVYPAAGLIDYYQGEKLALINQSATARAANANLVISRPIGQVFYECVLKEE